MNIQMMVKKPSLMHIFICDNNFSMKLNYIALLTLTLVFSSSKNISQDTKIIWSEKNLLTWDDFQGGIDNLSRQHAGTASGFKKSYKQRGDSLFILVSAEFDKTKSWYIKDKGTKYLLNHEQKHFDITEIFARKLRKAYQNFQFTKLNYAQDYLRIFNQHKLDREIYQNKYDSITNHSMNIIKQLEWDKKIAKELKDLESYSEKEIKLLLR